MKAQATTEDNKKAGDIIDAAASNPQQDQEDHPEDDHQEDQEHAASTEGLDIDDDMREQDRLLPIANVGRIMKLAVPPSAKISKEAKESVQECVSEFITFVSSEAADRCQQEKRKTINGEDIIWAMEQLGFDQYANLMKMYLQRYKEVTKMGDFKSMDASASFYGSVDEIKPAETAAAASAAGAGDADN